MYTRRGIGSLTSSTWGRGALSAARAIILMICGARKGDIVNSQGRTTDVIDRTGVPPLRGLKSLQPARQLIRRVTPPNVERPASEG